MGYLGDYDLDKEYGFESPGAEKGSREYGGGNAYDRDYLGVRDKYAEFKEQYGSTSRVDVGRADTNNTRPDFVGLGSKFKLPYAWGGIPSLFSSGVGPDGTRYDGQPLGSGCGTASTDGLVPDRIGDIDLTSACEEHDAAYENGEPKLQADLGLGARVYFACREAGYSVVVCGGLGYIYFRAVDFFGGSAYGKNKSDEK